MEALSPLIPAEAARKMVGGIARATFNSRLRAGHIPGVKLGGRWYVFRVWVEDILRRAAGCA